LQAKKKQGFLADFPKDGNFFPVVAAIAAGLYPLLFYYTNNYKMINSWGHLGYFVLLFILLPIIVFFVAHKISRADFLKNGQPLVLPFLNFFCFLSFLNIALYAGFSWLRTLIIFAIAVLLAFLLRKFFKKIIIFQFILAIIGIFTLAPVVWKQLNYSR